MSWHGTGHLESELADFSLDSEEPRQPIDEWVGRNRQCLSSSH